MNIDGHDEIERLRQEVRRLSSRVYFLQEENDELRRRVAFFSRELERTRAKIPATALRTS